MAIKYKVVSCTNPKGAEGVDYACNKVAKTPLYSTTQIVGNIEYKSTLSRTDIVAVVTALLHYIREALLAGENIVLDYFGIFYTKVSGRCFNRAVIGLDSFDPLSYITDVGVLFRPASSMKKGVVTDARLQRVPSELMA